MTFTILGPHASTTSACFDNHSHGCTLPPVYFDVGERGDADNVKAKIIAEAANGPLTNNGDRIVFEKGCFVIPDILANAGGVSVSYYEWVQNNYRHYWSEKGPVGRARQKHKGMAAVCHRTRQVGP